MAKEQKRISVAAGELMCYWPMRGGEEKQRGGWFKAESSDRVMTRDCCLMARALESVEYEEAFGVPYHSLKFSVVKRFYVDPKKPQAVAAHGWLDFDEFLKREDDRVAAEHELLHCSSNVQGSHKALVPA